MCTFNKQWLIIWYYFTLYFILEHLQVSIRWCDSVSDAYIEIKLSNKDTKENWYYFENNSFWIDISEAVDKIIIFCKRPVIHNYVYFQEKIWKFYISTIHIWWNVCAWAHCVYVFLWVHKHWGEKRWGANNTLIWSHVCLHLVFMCFTFNMQVNNVHVFMQYPYLMNNLNKVYI